MTHFKYTFIFPEVTYPFNNFFKTTYTELTEAGLWHCFLLETNFVVLFIFV